MGLNQPNRLYLLRPEVEATDIYLQANAETLDNSGTVKKTGRECKIFCVNRKKEVPSVE